AVTDEEPQAHALLARVVHLFDFPEPDPGGERFARGDEHIARGGAELSGLLEDGGGQVFELHGASYAWVPPTVRPSMRTVGKPTPTGTDWPSFPHVPMPSSSFRSLPTMVMRVSTSGPLPMSVAPLTGRVTLPPSIKYASLAEKTNLPLVISTCPPPKETAYRPRGTDLMMSSGVASRGSMKVLVIRGIGMCAKLSRRPLPVSGIFIRVAFRRSCR